MREILIIFTGVLLLISCDDATKTGRHVAKRQHAVEVVSVERQPLMTSKIITGTIEASRTVKIHSEEQGRIDSLPVYPGDRVTEKQVLLKLDNSLIKAEYDKARASYKLARLDYKRIKKLKPRKLASEDQLARAETALEQARAEQVLLQTRLDRATITAPFNGLISQRFNEEGDIVPLHSHILTIYDPKSLIARISVSEIILNSIKVGDQVELRVDALGNEIIMGRILRKHPLVDEFTRQSVIEIELIEPPKGIIPGQLTRVSIKGQTIPLITLPLSVVRHDTQGEYVYRIESGKAIFRRIQTGIQLGNKIEIIDGIDQGDKVVSKGFINLRDNAKVNVITKNASAQKNKPDQIHKQ